jgi:hypothetical protein
MHSAGLIVKGARTVKFGHTFKHPVDIERDDYQPTKPVPVVRDDAIVLWLDELYWSIRQMIVRTVADDARCREIEDWIASGRFSKAKR